MYKLIWNNETIEEEINTMKEAIYLKQEYQMAFKGCVSIKEQWGIIKWLIKETY